LNNFQFKNGLLYYKDLLYVPSGPLRLQVLQARHYLPSVSHFGFNKTMELISRDFWWPKMWKLVKEYIQSCDTCSRSSASTPWTTSTFTYTISTMDINIIGFHY
jgi:hypothetical protein